MLRWFQSCWPQAVDYALLQAAGESTNPGCAGGMLRSTCAWLGALTWLQALDLQGSACVSEGGAAVLGDAPLLQRLNLGGCYGESPQWLRAATRACAPLLTELYLDRQVNVGLLAHQLLRACARFFCWISPGKCDAAAPPTRLQVCKLAV